MKIGYIKFKYFAVALCFVMVFNSLYTSAQIITTFAGTGAFAFSGDSGPATDAALYYPDGVAVDGLGNVFIADEFNNRIRVVNVAGIISTIAGTGTAGYSGDGGTATMALLDSPSNVATDQASNIYFCDEGCNIIKPRIRMIKATTGIITTVAGNGILGFSGDGGPATAASLDTVVGIAIDDTGNLYIAEPERIRKVSVSGNISTITGNGSAGYSGDGGLASVATFNIINGIAVDATGIYIADAGNYRIRKIDNAGFITTIAGDGTNGFSGDGGPATNAEISVAYNVSVDGGGNVYIPDNSNRVRIVNTSGIISTIAGNGIAGYSGDGGIATDAELNFIVAVATDSIGNVYIADFFNSRVRKVSAHSTGLPRISIESTHLKVYPNPTDDAFTVTGTYSSVNQAVISVINVLGQVVYQDVADFQNDVLKKEINAKLPDGVYVLQVNSGTASDEVRLEVMK